MFWGERGHGLACMSVYVCVCGRVHPLVDAVTPVNLFSIHWVSNNEHLHVYSCVLVRGVNG